MFQRRIRQLGKGGGNLHQCMKDHVDLVGTIYFCNDVNLFLIYSGLVECMFFLYESCSYKSGEISSNL